MVNPSPVTTVLDISIVTELLSLKQEKVLNELKIFSLPTPFTLIETNKLYSPDVVIVYDTV